MIPSVTMTTSLTILHVSFTVVFHDMWSHKPAGKRSLGSPQKIWMSQIGEVAAVQNPTHEAEEEKHLARHVVTNQQLLSTIEISRVDPFRSQNSHSRHANAAQYVQKYRKETAPNNIIFTISIIKITHSEPVQLISHFHMLLAEGMI
jgi:hypothetical protein